MSTSIDCILGSGPAAVACATELLDAGRRVVMVDPNRRLAEDRASLAARFSQDPDRDAFVAVMRRLRQTVPRSLQASKLPFASTHVSDQTDRVLPLELQNAHVFRTLASGGLSAVWGATVIPMTDRSFKNWPFSLGEIAPFYRRVARIIDVPHVEDGLEDLYPNFGDAPPPPLTEQGAELMSHMLNARTRLKQAGIRFGRGRSAVGARYSINPSGCVGCGLCMYGCPYRAIFSAEYAVDELASRPGFTRRANWIAQGLREVKDHVNVRLRHLDNGVEETLHCGRLFVACGATTSLRLIADAMGWFERPFHLLDTQQFSIPAFLTSRVRMGVAADGFALSQAFIEIDRPDLADGNIHLQVYGFNPYFLDILRSRWGPLINERLLKPLLDRMMIVMGYLPGSLSGRLEMIVRPSESGGLAAASCVGHPNPHTRPAVRRIGRMLKAHAADFGWLPTLALTEVPAPGVSAHLAGCLPMKHVPGAGETDVLARPAGLRRVHVVDAACFPDLPSEHLTYTVMANAARIARRATEEGAE